ncbi:MAG: type II toxin-antitoxin system VapC family toxin [Acidimicrobiales bacterium]
MNLVDANVLLYAVNEADEKHPGSRRWLDRELSGNGTVGFAWISLLAFVRLSTKIGLFERPLAPTAALATVGAWLSQPAAVIVRETPRHLDVLGELLGRTGVGGNLTNDAHLAALALESRAGIVTFDSDFGRFPGVRWSTPEQLLSGG